ncbi:hypothetical protein BJY04DRAFT_213585 [Aspergillus karnatakaensis]|uniref:uncharacterized protein n=1 Tax=Aspergillus karnatakaensis TaxID=1810916 RepID=UPI003CCCBB31
MQPFTLPLPDNATVAGIHSIPSPLSLKSTSSPASSRPLIVALHGGTYDSSYFNGTPETSASTTSTSLGIPFVAIDRPCYGGTTSFLPLPEGSDFNEESGRWLHEYILPALWARFGEGCNALVLLCHSLGGMSGIVAASLHARDESPKYPLGGIIVSGLGDKTPVMSEAEAEAARSAYVKVGPDYLLLPVGIKDRIMFRAGTCDGDVLAQSERLNAATPEAEIRDFRGSWMETWKEKWAEHVVVPVIFSLVERDPFFVATREEVGVCLRAFMKSVRVDGGLMNGAPHCMELSYWSRGWYVRCFGFAMECSVGIAVGK